MTRWIIGVLVVAVLGIGVIVVVASGSDSDSAAGAAAGSDADVMAEFRACMTENGAALPEPPSEGEMPAPGGQPPGDGAVPPQQFQPSEDVQQAMEACADLMPEGSGFFTAPGGPPGIAPTPQN